MNRVLRKPIFSIICENKVAEDQRFYFRCTDIAISLLYKKKIIIQNFQPLAYFCDCSCRSVSDLLRSHSVVFLTTQPKYGKICSCRYKILQTKCRVGKQRGLSVKHRKYETEQVLTCITRKTNKPTVSK